MENVFNKHPRANGFSGYLKHARFALGASFRLLLSASIFLAHGLLPFVPVPRFLNFEATVVYLENKNKELN